MTSKKKLLQEIHPLHLIREVQNQPALYVRNSPEMANTHFRMQIWSEVAQNLFPDWHLLSEHNKEIKVTGIMKKWRNLRDTFKRQVEVQKKIRAGYNIKKKVYVYFKHMSFLLPHFQDEDQEDMLQPGVIQGSKKNHTRKNITAPRHEAVPFPNPVFLEDIDEDKHFLMSLVPSFKRMTEDEKLTAKMEILKVIKTVKGSSISGVGGISFHEVDSLTSDSNLMGVKTEASPELCQIDAETDHDSNMDSE